MLRSLFIVLAFVLITCAGFSQVYTTVPAEQFRDSLHTGRFVLLDLRTDDEIKNKGKIKDAIQIDYLAQDAEMKIRALDKTKRYLIYCAGGGRSAECGELMNSLGFMSVVELKNGFDAWRRLGYEVEKNK